MATVQDQEALEIQQAELRLAEIRAELRLNDLKLKRHARLSEREVSPNEPASDGGVSHEVSIGSEIGAEPPALGSSRDPSSDPEYQRRTSSVQLFRTESAAFRDELYSPSKSYSSVNTKRPISNPRSPANSSIIAQRLQTADLARSMSASGIRRERSPARDNSPRASDWPVSAAGTITTAASIRQQQNDSAVAVELSKQHAPLTRAPSRTVSPEAALIDWAYDLDQTSTTQDSTSVGYETRTYVPEEDRSSSAGSQQTQHIGNPPTHRNGDQDASFSDPIPAESEQISTAHGPPSASAAQGYRNTYQTSQQAAKRRSNRYTEMDWSQQEDHFLLQLVSVHGTHDWVRVSSTIQTRSPMHCRERYYGHLQPNFNHDPITPEEGILIEELVAAIGKRWVEIASRLRGRSDNAVKKWWNEGMNRRRRKSRQHRAESEGRHQQAIVDTVSFRTSGSSSPAPSPMTVTKGEGQRSRQLSWDAPAALSKNPSRVRNRKTTKGPREMKRKAEASIPDDHRICFRIVAMPPGPGAAIQPISSRKRNKTACPGCQRSRKRCSHVSDTPGVAIERPSESGSLNHPFTVTINHEGVVRKTLDFSFTGPRLVDPYMTFVALTAHNSAMLDLVIQNYFGVTDRDWTGGVIDSWWSKLIRLISTSEILKAIQDLPDLQARYELWKMMLHAAWSIRDIKFMEKLLLYSHTFITQRVYLQINPGNDFSHHSRSSIDLLTETTSNSIAAIESTYTGLHGMTYDQQVKIGQLISRIPGQDYDVAMHLFQIACEPSHPQSSITPPPSSSVPRVTSHPGQDVPPQLDPHAAFREGVEHTAAADTLRITLHDQHFEIVSWLLKLIFEACTSPI